jgi:hypothetical protein
MAPTVLFTRTREVFFKLFLKSSFQHIVRLSGVEITALNVCTYIRDLTFCLAYFNSVLNPILYSFLGYGFRNRFVIAMRKVKRATSVRKRKFRRSDDRRPKNMLAQYL